MVSVLTLTFYFGDAKSKDPTLRPVWNIFDEHWGNVAGNPYLIAGLGDGDEADVDGSHDPDLGNEDAGNGGLTLESGVPEDSQPVETYEDSQAVDDYPMPLEPDEEPTYTQAEVPASQDCPAEASVCPAASSDQGFRECEDLSSSLAKAKEEASNMRDDVLGKIQRLRQGLPLCHSN